MNLEAAEAYGKYPAPRLDQFVLTDEQKQTLADNYLAVTNPIPQADFGDNVTYFRNRSNNFLMFFLNSGIEGEEQNFFSAVYQSQEVFQRFCLVRPELAEQLIGTDMFDGTFPLETYLEAYTVMTALVDANDKGVTRTTPTGDTEYITWFLCQ